MHKRLITMKSILSAVLALLATSMPICVYGAWRHATLFDYPVGEYSLNGWSRSQDFNNQYEGHGYHLGEDWGMGDGRAMGQPVNAIGDGLVLKAEYVDECWANTVLILHTAPEGTSYSLPNGEKSDYVVSFYGHLSNLMVRRNQQLRKGDPIGKVAPKTSCSSSAHLHFEVRKDIYPMGSKSADGPGYFKHPVAKSDSWIPPSEFIELNRNLYHPITPYGFGQINFGMITNDAVDKGLYPGDGIRFDSTECYYGHISTHPNLGFMFEGMRVVRVDTDDTQYATAEGVRVGDSEQKVKLTYGTNLAIESHQYIERGHYMIIKSSDKLHALVMETDGSKVTRIRGGLVPAVFYVEGCE